MPTPINIIYILHILFLCYTNKSLRCGPCKQIAPYFKELSDEFGRKVQFIKVDVDDNPDAAAKYGVSAMPTFVFIKGGEVVDRLMGANTERLRQLVEEWSF